MRMLLSGLLVAIWGGTAASGAFAQAVSTPTPYGVASPTSVAAPISSVAAPVVSGVGAPPVWMDDGHSEGGGSAIWFRGEYLYWKFKNQSAPPLVTTGPVGALPTLDLPTTQVVFGDGIEGKDHSGGRFTIGVSLATLGCCESPWSLEFTGFLTDRQDAGGAFGSPGVPQLARPFIDVNPASPGQSVEQVANPTGSTFSAVAGSVIVNAPSRLSGYEVNALRCLCADECHVYNIEALVGFRYIRLDEALQISENLVGTDVTDFGDTNQLNDRFVTRNIFRGAQVGLRGELNRGQFFLDGVAKLGFGSNRESVFISGNQTNTPLGLPPITVPVGLLAQQSNIGNYSRERFCFAPEVGLDLGVHLTSHIAAFIGYNFLYLSDVVRPGEQIDPQVNSSFLPVFAGGMVLPPMPVGPNHPAFAFHSSDFWAQGLTTGLEITW